MKRRRKQSRNTEEQIEAQKCEQEQREFSSSKGGREKPTTKNSWAQLRKKVGTAEAGKVNGLVQDDFVTQIKVLEPHPMVGETLSKGFKHTCVPV